MSRAQTAMVLARPARAFGSRSVAPPAAGAGTDALPTVLSVGFLLYTFVGTNPLADDAAFVSGEGNGAERIALLGLAALAALVAATRFATTWRTARQGWTAWLLVGWFAAGVAWAAFPDISLRRVVSTILVTFICLAMAASLDSLRRAHAILLAVLGAVIAADIAVTLLRPDFAVTDIGIRGFHSQKNVAGTVGMVATIAAAGWIVGSRDARGRALGLAVALPAAAFLIGTDSKTSVALTGLALLLMPAAFLARRAGAAATLLIAALLVGAALTTLAAAAAFDLDLLALLTPNGDTSFTGRTEIWEFARAEIAKRPWTGYGYGSFWDVGPDNDPLLRAPPGSWLGQVRQGSGNIINEAHNGYLDLLIQGGVPALALALLVAARTVGIFLGRLFEPGRKTGERSAAVTFLVILAVFILHNATESSIWMRGQILANLSIVLGFLAFRQAAATVHRRPARPASPTCS